MRGDDCWTIEKDFAFSASHCLTGLREGHPCARMHGHNYVVRVRLANSYLNAQGFVLDYGDLAPFGRWVDEHLDHRHLNDALPALPNPTAEHLAAALAAQVRGLLMVPVGAAIAVGVSETPKTWAWWWRE